MMCISVKIIYCTDKRCYINSLNGILLITSLHNASYRKQLWNGMHIPFGL